MKFLAIVHGYYEELWSDLAECLLQLHDPFDLRVTCVRHLREISAMVHEQFPAATVELVENRGFDVGPFLYVLNSVNLDEYTAVIKLHTKRDIPPHYEMRVNVTGSLFRKRLLSFARTPTTWQRSLKLLSENNIGMVGEGSLALNKFSDSLKDYTGVFNIMKRLNIKFHRNSFFIAGTMFIVRANLLKIFQNQFSLEDFEIPDRSKGDCLPHFLERVLGYSIYSQGYHIASWDGKPFAMAAIWWRFKRFLFHIHYGTNHDIVRICRIPVWYRKNSGR